MIFGLLMQPRAALPVEHHVSPSKPIPKLTVEVSTHPKAVSLQVAYLITTFSKKTKMLTQLPTNPNLVRYLDLGSLNQREFEQDSPFPDNQEKKSRQLSSYSSAAEASSNIQGRRSQIEERSIHERPFQARLVL